MGTPYDFYQRYSKRYPRKLIEPTSMEIDENYRLDANGRLRWKGRWLHVSSALGAEMVQVM